jgi:hypothetical protein
MIPQPVAPQVAMPFAGTVHAEQDVPHDAGLLSDLQVPLQSCVPAGHMPMQASLIGMQVPLHNFIVAGHAFTHDRPSQVTVPPPDGLVQAVVHSVGPHVARAMLLTHPLPQR